MIAPLQTRPLLASRPTEKARAAAGADLALAPEPPGASAVEDADGSLAYRGPSWARKRLEANNVKLVVMRHGQSEANAAQGILLYGQSETPLTAKGQQQARDCAETFFQQLGGDDFLRECAADPKKLPVFLSSPVSRAFDTATVVCDKLRSRAKELGLGLLPLEVKKDARLLETDFGRFEKRDLAEVEAKYPEFIQNWRPPEGMGTDFRHRFPGGESRADLMRRTGSLLNGVAALYPGRTVVLMSHSECILGMRTVLGDAPQQEGKIRAETGAIANARPYWLVGDAPRDFTQAPAVNYPL